MLTYIHTFGPYSHLIISIALGMLVGLQREWADSPAAGIRTFSFITLFGTACSLISETYGLWFVGLGLISTMMFAGMAHFQTIKSKGEFQTSMVTGVTMLLMYIVGVMVRHDLFLPAAAMACLIALILHVKMELHALADKFTSSELSSVMQFLLIALVILPIMPDRSFGPNDALNLHNIWLMVVLIVGISLAGYILHKLAGQRSGVIGGGLIGGLISSTVTTFSYSRLSSRHSSSSTFHALVILIAWTVVYFRAYLEIQVVSPNIPIHWPLILMVVVSLLMILFTWRKNLIQKEEADITNKPIDLKTAIFFGFFYALLIAVFSYFNDDISRTALYGVTFVAGILDIDAITLSTARLVDRKILSPDRAVSYVFVALFSNTLFKGLICLFLGKNPLFNLILLPWIGSLVIQLIIIGWYW
jgi:uncharacterized membrane protein (DUF4010 family)